MNGEPFSMKTPFKDDSKPAAEASYLRENGERASRPGRNIFDNPATPVVKVNVGQYSLEF